MERTIQDIKTIMTDGFINDPIVISNYGLVVGQTFEQQFSDVSIENILFGNVAICVWTIENILGITIDDQNKFIADTKIHSLTWYATYAKKFQFGMSLAWGMVEYDNSSLTDDEVLAMQVVKYCSVTKVPGFLMIKVATIVNNDLAPIPNAQLTAFEQYMFRVSAAGDNLLYTNAVADSLKIGYKIYYDRLILDSTGKRLDGTNDTPVQNALDVFLKGIDFNNRLITTYMTDALQQVEGVVIPFLLTAQTQYAALPYSDIPPEGTEPHSGYFRIIDPVNDLFLEFIPYTN